MDNKHFTIDDFNKLWIELKKTSYNTSAPILYLGEKEIKDLDSWVDVEEMRYTENAGCRELMGIEVKSVNKDSYASFQPPKSCRKWHWWYNESCRSGSLVTGWDAATVTSLITGIIIFVLCFL